MNYFILIAILLSGLSVKAHPGIGIVSDSKGNIYYTDLVNVYRLSVDGKISIAVPNVHTHELSIDNADNLYGEQQWYNGERLNTWGHYVWKRAPDGTISKVIEPKAGFLENYGFLRDSMNNVYWLERFTISRFMKKSPDGTIVKIAEGKFKNIRWQYCTKNGTIYFVDIDKLYRIRNGEIDLIAKDLSKNSPNISVQNKVHDVFGIWTDRKNHIYAAVFASDEIIRISPDGVISTIAKSPAGWSPTGGTEDVFGNLWILEYNEKNNARVRKIVPVAFKTAGRFHQVGIPMIMTALLAAFAVYVATMIVKAYRG